MFALIMVRPGILSILRYALILHRREQRPPPRLGIPPRPRQLTRALHRSHPQRQSNRISPTFYAPSQSRQNGHRRPLEREYGLRYALSQSCVDRRDALTACRYPEPVKTALNVVEAPVAIFRLAAAIYPAGAWAKSPPPHIPPAEFDESWQLRSGLSSWAWRAIGELKDNGAPAPPCAFDPLTPSLKPASSLSQRRPCLDQTCSPKS